MAGSRHSSWLPWLLFHATVGIAGLLALLVVAAPWLSPGDGTPGAGRVLALFAHDSALRQTSVASAVGLVVTALVFFRPSSDEPKKKPSRLKGRRNGKRPPPPSIAGA